jgi:hypothetical protein
MLAIWKSTARMLVLSEFEDVCLLSSMCMIPPIPVAAQSKAWVCDRSLFRTAGSNLSGDIEVCLLLSAVFCQVEVSVMGRTLIQGSASECVSLSVTKCNNDLYIYNEQV